LRVTLKEVTSYDDLGCHIASRASLWECSPSGLIAAAAAAAYHSISLSVPFLPMICVAFSMTILRAWQEHNIIRLKQDLAAGRPALVLFFLSFFVCNSIITTHSRAKAQRGKIFHMGVSLDLSSQQLPLLAFPNFLSFLFYLHFYLLRCITAKSKLLTVISLDLSEQLNGSFLPLPCTLCPPSFSFPHNKPKMP
jgi:hypothetical protein